MIKLISEIFNFLSAKHNSLYYIYLVIFIYLISHPIAVLLVIIALVCREKSLKVFFTISYSTVSIALSTFDICSVLIKASRHMVGTVIVPYYSIVGKSVLMLIY